MSLQQPSFSMELGFVTFDKVPHEFTGGCSSIWMLNVLFHPWLLGREFQSTSSIYHFNPLFLFYSNLQACTVDNDHGNQPNITTTLFLYIGTRMGISQFEFRTIESFFLYIVMGILQFELITTIFWYIKQIAILHATGLIITPTGSN